MSNTSEATVEAAKPAGSSGLLSVDMHCHLLPGIDDGAKTLEDTEAIARKFVEYGIHETLCTSHIQDEVYPNSRAILLPLVASTQAHLDAVGIPLKLHAGAEVRLDPESCRKDTWLTVGDMGTYMLVELPPGIPLVAMLETQLFEIQAAGITPIIAHPERMAYLQKDPTILERWVVERGMLAQGTLCTLAGAAGERAIKTLEGFLSKGLIHVMGTDAHACDRRLRDLDQAVARLEVVVGAENAHLIRFTNPRHVIAGTPVRRPHPYDPPAPEGFVKRLMASFFPPRARA